MTGRLAGKVVLVTGGVVGIVIGMYQSNFYRKLPPMY